MVLEAEVAADFKPAIVCINMPYTLKKVIDLIIYVGNLSLDITEEQLKSFFQAFGKVQSVAIMNDKYIGSGQPRGYGYIEMASKSEGEAAIAGLKGTVINDHLINIVEALPLERKDSGYLGKRLTLPRRRT